jgi:hypothetical protein
MSINNYEINGIIDTSNNVFDNIELLAISSGCFVTWDASEGKWSVVINQAGSSIFSFDDSNILGPITVGTSGINDLYNSVEIQYPHKDLRDVVDYLTVSVDASDRFPNELDNALQINLSTVNEPVQAQYIATQELKQNRIDKVIEFKTDFQGNGLKAGDIIDVTNTPLNFTSKAFRIIQINEQDTDEGAIVLSITAAEYSADVYNITGLTYDLRTKNTGIPSKIVNEEIEALDDQDAGASIGRLLLANAAAKVFNGLLGSLFGDPSAEGALTEQQQKEANDQTAFLNGIKKPPLTHAPSVTEICEGGSVTINFTDDCETCYFDVPDYEYEYTITGIDAGDIDIPLEGTVSITGGAGSISFNTTVDGDAYETLTFTCGENSTDIVIQSPQAYSYESISATSTSITEGDSVDITITSANIADGETRDYEITGTAVDNGSVSTATTGTVTFNSNSATITVATTNDSVYTGGESYTFTVDPSFSNPCAVNDERAITIDVADDESAPAPDVSCDYQSVPIVWCGVWDGTTGYLKSVSVHSSANLPVASTGGTAVPLTCSVSNANTASAAVSIDSTVNIDTSVVAGTSIDVITSFGAAGSGPYLTGTTTTVRGS